MQSIALHYEGAFEPVQVGVGLSRVPESKQITVMNFDSHLCSPQSTMVLVQGFYASPQSCEIQSELSCCI